MRLRSNSRGSLQEAEGPATLPGFSVWCVMDDRARWMQTCYCAEAAQRFAMPWLLDERRPLALRWPVAAFLLFGDAKVRGATLH